MFQVLVIAGLLCRFWYCSDVAKNFNYSFCCPQSTPYCMCVVFAARQLAGVVAERQSAALSSSDVPYDVPARGHHLHR